VGPRFDLTRWGGSSSHWRRLKAALAGASDGIRPPVTTWRHFPELEHDAESLARSHLAYQIRFGFDLVVLTPPHAFLAQAWGYEPGDSFDEFGKPTDPVQPFAGADHWPDLRSDRHMPPSWDMLLDSAELVKRNLEEDTPLLLTVYGPLTTAYFLRGKDIARDIETERTRGGTGLREALKVVSNGTAELCRRALEVADGLYYISYFAAEDIPGGPHDAAWAFDRDTSLLRDHAGAECLLVLHLHGNQLMFDEALDLPVDVFNWHDRSAKPSLREARLKTLAPLMGGMNEVHTVHHETQVAVMLQVQDASDQVDGRGLIVSPGGPISLRTPPENLDAALRALD